MLAAINPNPNIDDAEFAELSKLIVQIAIESQNEKKKNLLSTARKTNKIRRIVERSATKQRQTQQQSLSSHIKVWRKQQFVLSDLSQLVEDINSNERFNQHLGVIGVRRLLSREEGPTVQPIIDANLVPRMIEFMQREDEPQLQIEAAWVLTNVSSGTTAQTQIVIDRGAIPWFTKILRSKDPNLSEQALWALANISGDSPVHRDIVLKHGALYPLMKIVDGPDVSKNMKNKGTWAISNLCRGRPEPEVAYVRAAIPTLFNAIHQQDDREVLTDATWALSFLSDDESSLGIIMGCPNAIPDLVAIMSMKEQIAILMPCLRTLGNICTGNDYQTDMVIECPGFLENLYNLMENERVSVRRESLWIMSNITAGTGSQITKFFASFPFVERLVSCIQNDPSDDVRAEGLWVFSNALISGNTDIFETLWDAKVLDCFVLILQTMDKAPMLKASLDGIYSMLKTGAEGMFFEHGKEENIVLVELEKAGALERLEALQDFDDEDVYETAEKIINEFITY